ncbi:MAG: DNA-processing protein DprA [Pseudomonadales bacterium]
MTAAPTLTSSDYQYLAVLAKYGRRRLRDACSKLCGASDSADVGSLEQSLDGEQRQRLLSSFAADQLPWQTLAAQMQSHGISVLIGADLPRWLRYMPDPPMALYVRGQPQLLQQPAIAVVGARRASQRGLNWAHRVAQGLADSGLMVVSGMALGVDAAAHRGALDADGPTTAVLGSGLLRPSPASNEALMRRILDSGGAVVSEYPLTLNASKYTFPERNRIITGLALGLLVVEAGPRSGTLISARMALEQGREVMAVPGPVGSPVSIGCHRLIKQGAALVETVEDVLEALDWQPLSSAASAPAHSSARRLPQSPAAASLLAHIDGTVTTVDALIAASKCSAEKVSATLTLLELDGFVQRVAQGYIRSP